jgi:hypothetical protein
MLFLFPFILSNIFCKTMLSTMFAGCSKLLKQKITCLVFPNAILIFFSQQIRFRDILIYIYIYIFGGLEFVGHYFAFGAHL